MSTRYYVLYRSSFAYDAAPNISHETESTTSERTYCGRKVADAETFEPDDNDRDPCCITCRKIARKRAADAERERERSHLQLLAEVKS